MQSMSSSILRQANGKIALGVGALTYYSNHHFKKEDSLRMSHLLPCVSSTLSEPLPRYENLAFENKWNSSRKNRDDYKEVEYHCDYAIIGHGNAGKAAKRRLQRLCPKAEILVIDPLMMSYTNDAKSNNQIRLLQATASGICPSKKEVYASFLSGSGSDKNKNLLVYSRQGKIIYRKSCLIATGCHGAPPPSTLFDDRAMGRVLELRPTLLPQPFYVSSNKEEGRMDEKTSTLAMQARPIMTRDGITQIAEMAIQEGANICILGSSMEALDLALSLNEKSNVRAKSGLKGGTVTLITGGSGPLHSRLPRFLITALLKRIQSSTGIIVDEQSLVRYVAMNHDRKTGSDVPLEIYTVKAYDMLETRRHLSDLLIVAPDVENYKGHASLLSTNIQSPFINWTEACDDNSIACYSDDARIAVNVQLSATEGIYAAGSVARYPNLNEGKASVAGEGKINSYLAGEFAAVQMYRTYLYDDELNDKFSFGYSNIPIWSSSLNVSPENIEVHHSVSKHIGIEALCVGNCDAETMATHSFWWTNRSANMRKRRSSLHYKNPEEYRNTLTRRKSATSSELRKPVHGRGVVYYFDKHGKLCGMMTWGLPLKCKGGQTIGCSLLLTRMKELIQSNGVCTLSNAKEDLDSTHLIDETKMLAELAMEESGNVIPDIYTDENVIARPLHTYIPAKHQIGFKLGWMKRGKRSGVSETESMFCGQNDPDVLVQRPPSLVRVYPMDSFKTLWTISRHDDSSEDNTVTKEDRIASKQDIDKQSRPLEEDPLWLRKKDISRTKTLNETSTEAFRHNIGTVGGSYYDGHRSHKWL